MVQGDQLSPPLSRPGVAEAPITCFIFMALDKKKPRTNTRLFL
jgi:hypothetical protein